MKKRWCVAFSSVIMLLVACTYPPLGDVLRANIPDTCRTNVNPYPTQSFDLPRYTEDAYCISISRVETFPMRGYNSTFLYGADDAVVTIITPNRTSFRLPTGVPLAIASHSFDIVTVEIKP